MRWARCPRVKQISQKTSRTNLPSPPSSGPKPGRVHDVPLCLLSRKDGGGRTWQRHDPDEPARATDARCRTVALIRLGHLAPSCPIHECRPRQLTEAKKAPGLEQGWPSLIGRGPEYSYECSYGVLGLPSECRSQAREQARRGDALQKPIIRVREREREGETSGIY